MVSNQSVLEFLFDSTIVSALFILLLHDLSWSRCLPYPLLRDVGGHWNPSILLGKCFWSVLQPRSNQRLESSATTAG